MALLFRAISLLLTSVFFLFGPQAPWIFKLGIIGALLVAAWIIADLQKRYIGNVKVIQAIVLTETIGLTLLLIPTGGITSPFIWYALNPVLIAAGYLAPLYCWGALTFYLGNATFITFSLAGADSIRQVVEERSYFYLVCLLTTLLVSLFSRLTKELDANARLLRIQQDELLFVNEKLRITNEKYIETMEHIMSFYQLTEGMTSKKNAGKVMVEVTESLRKCTRCEEAFFWLISAEQRSQIVNRTKFAGLELELQKAWHWIRNQSGAFAGNFGEEVYLMKVIRTSSNNGVVGVKIGNLQEDWKPLRINRPFEAIAELGELMLERISMDRMMDQMLILEEQNRIANEIHDSVSQRLFGIVYSLHSLKGKSQFMTKEELDEEYTFLSVSAQETMKELRAAIYSLSPVKKGEKPFFSRIAKYVKDFAKLNDICINHNLEGHESILSSDLKEAIYRIVCEACGNAVRHGKCKRIELEILITDEKTEVTIWDDGNGFQSMRGRDRKEQGIGLYNMQQSVNLFGGNLSIDSPPDFGTTIRIEIPKSKTGKMREMIEL
ncbi:sensor histidine kinase [Sporosarcina sp. SAFN-015]|uniref:sensor histidine kinase n=1 Tax=Sporosarcina sp. SAFN-015 TaxID=3387274 RepID=UPI003F7DF4A4